MISAALASQTEHRVSRQSATSTCPRKPKHQINSTAYILVHMISGDSTNGMRGYVKNNNNNNLLKKKEN